MLLLAHAQFHYRDAAEVTIAIADSRITSRYLNYRYYRSALAMIILVSFSDLNPNERVWRLSSTFLDLI